MDLHGSALAFHMETLCMVPTQLLRHHGGSQLENITRKHFQLQVLSDSKHLPSNAYGTSHPIMKDLQNVQPEPLARCLHPHGEHPSQCKVHLCPIVKNEHQCSSNTSHNIGQKSLVETPHQSLLSSNLLETVHGAFVDVFFHWLL